MNHNKNHKNWRILVLSVLLPSTLAITACNKTDASSNSPAPTVVDTNLNPAPGAPIVRITELNDRLVNSFGSLVALYAGQQVKLEAGLFELDGDNLNQPKENFVWSANDFSGDICDPQFPLNCQEYSNFIVTNDGVYYRLPQSGISNISISVRSKISTALDRLGRPQLDHAYVQNLGLIPQAPEPAPWPRPEPRPDPRPFPDPHHPGGPHDPRDPRPH